ncbi:MAG: hypothetical protein ACRBBR_16960 [Cellvibrionaceae bacterium]
MKYTSYEELLEFGLEEADTFSIVWRNMAFDDSAFDLVEDLSPWLVSDFSSHSWPGTELLEEKARVKTYEVNSETIKILNCVSSVFDLQAPKYPEDLAFYRGKDVLFGSVAHEGMAWFTT